MGSMTPEQYAKFALDRGRLGVLGLLAVADRTTGELVEETGAARRDVLEWIGLLAVDGLVEKVSGARWHLRDEGLVAVADQLPSPPAPAARVFFGLTADERDVIARYASGNRLTEIPAKRSHRLVVLERLALEFEPGRRYPEAEVNGVLSLWHPDYAALRRALVDEGFMDRAGGEYWRAGGRVDV
ncbi:DUF2087 domain-containing protein [Euzebya sp.]|uniref:DUF2087 domain-containing protein n=1 Tax=Euzebya sp. TaxID=1971409 RepID=UPI0035182A20